MCLNLAFIDAMKTVVGTSASNMMQNSSVANRVNKISSNPLVIQASKNVDDYKSAMDSEVDDKGL